MNLSEIEAQLPNGFHDAKIKAICRNLNTESVDVHLDVLTGTPDNAPEHQNEFRTGVLKFTGAKIVITEEPHAESSFAYAGGVTFVLNEDEPESISVELLAMLEGEYHTYTFFVQEWFANIKVAASGVEFSWSRM